MDRRTFIKTLPALTVLADAVPSIAEEPSTTTLQPIILPKPEKDGGKSVLGGPVGTQDEPQHQPTRSFPSRCCRTCFGPPGA